MMTALVRQDSRSSLTSRHRESKNRCESEKSPLANESVETIHLRLGLGSYLPPGAESRQFSRSGSTTGARSVCFNRLRLPVRLPYQHMLVATTPGGICLRSITEDIRKMRALLSAVIIAASLSTFVGCIIPAYSGDPARRTQQLIFTSENLRLFLDDWERIWFLDQPSHLTPYRTHGGII